MSNPTFNGSALCSAAAAETIHSPAARLQIESLPGVDGEFVQVHGHGGRTIEVRGILRATGETPAGAHQNLKALLRAKQALADGDTVASYVGTDSTVYGDCVVTSYQPTPPVHVSAAAGQYKAMVRVAVELRQLAP